MGTLIYIFTIYKNSHNVSNNTISLYLMKYIYKKKKKIYWRLCKIIYRIPTLDIKKSKLYDNQ